MKRIAKIKRETKETKIELILNLDGKGLADISSGVGFFDHMLTHLARHSGWDISLSAKGDLDVDAHHTVEDVGICLGNAIKESLGSKAGVKRFASASVPMDETLANVAVDISGRPMLVYHVSYGSDKIGEFDVHLVREFWQAVSSSAGITLHIQVPYGANSHHIAEAIFKSAAQSLGQAVKIVNPSGDIPSTKGQL
jgi:imidazoleglycerol-phosphate dehydratase